MHTPDEVLLRRFGHVRAVGGAAYFLGVAVLFVLFDTAVWPMLLAVPVLAVVTTAYFVKSADYPRFSVAASLAADAMVLAASIAFFGGTGSGLVLLYAIVVVSAGILLGPGAAATFTLSTVALGSAQLVLEQLGVEPALLHREDLDDRILVLLVSLAGLVSVGYLSATYASRLHDLIAVARAEAEEVRDRGKRRRTFVDRVAEDLRLPLSRLEGLADLLDDRWERLSPEERGRLAARMRMGVTDVEAGVETLAEVGVVDLLRDSRPVPVLLRRVVDDCVVSLGERLEAYPLHVDVPPIKVLADRRGARRVVFNLIENVVDHCPPGTRVRVAGVTRAGQGVLVVADDGPGVPPEAAKNLFGHPPAEPGGAGAGASTGSTASGASGASAGSTGSTGSTASAASAGSAGSDGDVSIVARVGLPLVAELCEGMGARVYYEPAPGGGSRFVVVFRLAPPAAPSEDDERARGAGAPPHPGGGT